LGGFGIRSHFNLLELPRSEVLRLKPGSKGLLRGLADPVIAKSLSAMHGEVAGMWTVAKLARLCGVSRSTFATRFKTVMGLGPMEYLANWRIALAKDELSFRTKAIGEIALSVGFQSSSAFSTAFTRAVSCSPKRFSTESATRITDPGRSAAIRCRFPAILESRAGDTANRRVLCTPWFRPRARTTRCHRLSELLEL